MSWLNNIKPIETGIPHDVQRNERGDIRDRFARMGDRWVKGISSYQMNNWISQRKLNDNLTTIKFRGDVRLFPTFSECNIVIDMMDQFVGRRDLFFDNNQGIIEMLVFDLSPEDCTLLNLYFHGDQIQPRELKGTIIFCPRTIQGTEYRWTIP